MTSMSSVAARVAAATLFVLLTSNPILGQVRWRWEDEPLPPAEEILRSFESSASGKTEPGVGEGAIQFIRSHRGLVSPQSRIDEVLDGLEQLAISTVDPRVGMRVVTVLTMFGHRDLPDPMPGVVARLHRVYAEAESVAVLRSILGVMQFQAEEEEAAEFLTTVAVQSTSSCDFERSPWIALYELWRMGDVGEAALNKVRGGPDRPLTRPKFPLNTTASVVKWSCRRRVRYR